MITDIIINGSDKASPSGFTFTTFLNELPLLFSVIAALFAALVYQRDNTYKNLTFLESIDKMLIQEPVLWAIYNSLQDVIGDEWKGKKGQAAGKLDAFCYYIINTIEIVYINTHKGWILNNKSMWTAWENYLLELMNKSTRFYDCARYVCDEQLINKKFRAVLDQLSNKRDINAPSRIPLDSFFMAEATRSQEKKEGRPDA